MVAPLPDPPADEPPGPAPDPPRDPAPDEARLLERARAGDAAAREALFAPALGRLLTYARLRLGPALAGRVEPGDLAQEACAEALRSLDRYEPRGPGSFARWLCAICENRLRDLAKAGGRAKRRAPGLPVGLTVALDRARARATGPVSAALREERAADLSEALERLPEDEREVVLLRFLGGRTVDQVAEATGRSASAVRRTVARALSTLGHLLAEHADGEGAR